MVLCAMRHIDFFDFFRYSLATVVGIYATVVTLQSLYGWYVFLTGPEKYMNLVRRYVIIQGLRLRVQSFWGDVVVCIGLLIVLGIVAYAHHQVSRIHPWVDDQKSLNVSGLVKTL
jgi:hypothetical protein